MGTVNRAEWRWVAVFAAVVIAAMLLPYLIAYQAQGTGWRFTGFLWGVADGNTYIAKMRAGADGTWLFRLRYTAEPQNGVLLFLPYLWLGKLAAGAGMHEQLTALLHLARIAADAWLIGAVYRFLALFIESVSIRRWALAVSILGGGLGWLAAAFGVQPLEYLSPETFSFMELFGPPHLAAARALLLTALTLYLSPPTDAGRDLRQGILAGAALAGAWLFQPLEPPIAWAMMGAHAGWMFWRGLGAAGAGAWKPFAFRLAGAVLVSLPGFLYSALTFTLDPVHAASTAQNQVASLAWWQYLLAYGLLLAPALAGVWLARRDTRASLLAGWLILLPVLISVPIGMQRRLTEGAWIALAALAAIWFERAASAGVRRAAMPALLGAVLPTFLLLYGGSFPAAMNPAPPVFLPAAEVAAFAWLDAHAQPGDVIASGFDAGNALPAYTSLTAFLGHGVETVRAEEKAALMRLIFDGARPPVERVTLLAQTGAVYVLTGPADMRAAGGRIPGCMPVFEQDGWTVCRVQAVA